MEDKEKKLKQQIEVLEKTLIELKSWESNHEKVQDEIKLISESIIDKKLELIGFKVNISFKDRLINDFIKNKLVFLNLVWIIFEGLNLFTDFFQNSNNETLRAIGLLIPGITIYLKTKKDGQ